MNFRRYCKESVSVTMDESTTMDHLRTLVSVFAEAYTSGDPDGLKISPQKQYFVNLTFF